MKLKIGFVLDDSLDRPAGVQQYILTVGQWLKSQGHDVHYLVSTTKRHDIENIHSLSRNIPARFNGNQMKIPLPASRTKIRQFIKQQKFDILHIQMPYSPFLAGIIINAAEPQTAVIGTFHIVPNNQIVNIANHLLSILCFRSLKRFDQVVSVSTAAQTFAKSAYQLPSIVLPNAISLTKFRSAELFPDLRQSNRQNILFLGKLVPRKGCSELLEAIKLLKQQNKTLPINVIICGEGPLAERLQRYVKAHNLSDIVQFKGFVSETDKLRYFASSDLTIFPSLGGESFGIVLLEAMASGKAAILASNISGYQTLLKDCPGNVLFNALLPKELANKIKLLLNNSILRNQIIEWQYQRASDFDIQLIGPKISSIYYSALQRRRNMQ